MDRLNDMDFEAAHARALRCTLVAGAATVVFGCLLSGVVHAAGTEAGREVNNTATVSYQIGGEDQTPVTSNTAQLFVDELLDVSVTSDDVGPVAVTSPAAGAVLAFTITNTGNGTEAFRLVADDTLPADGFDPVVDEVYVESNGIPGLQTGPGGDTPYALAGDPVLAADEAIAVYLTSSIEPGLASNLEGAVSLRAVPVTLVSVVGSDNPVDFPSAGTAFSGAGDPQQGGAGNVAAVVGTSLAVSGSVLVEVRYVVSAAVVALSKSAVAIVDPFGGSTVVSGSVITYELVAEVQGTGAAEALVINDILPAELEYVSASLTVSALPSGEEADDDFAPLGADNTGYDPNTTTVTVNLGDQAGGGSISISYQASIR